MKESDVEGKCVELLDKVCPGAVIYKHADRWTAGIPDRSITWRGYDSWIEFKLWDQGVSFYDEFATKQGRPNTQLLELIKLENAAGRAWVAAYREANPRKLIKPSLELYRPSAMVDAEHFVRKASAPPFMHWSVLENVASDLRTFGLAQFDGFDHRAIASLIHLTHRRE